MDKKFQTWLWIGIASVVIIAIVAIAVGNRRSNSTASQPARGNTQTTSHTTVVSTSTQNVSVEGQGTGTLPTSYEKALAMYADRRIQLNQACQATPYSVTYKDNTGVMIDNRSPNQVTVKVGTTFTIKPWGFKIVVLPNIYLASKVLYVDCNASQNVAKILIQE